jgi:ribonuclease D
LARCREVVTHLASENNVPPENLVAPDTVRRLAWTPPEKLDVDAVSDVLAGMGARPWQVGVLADQLTAALRDPA